MKMIKKLRQELLRMSKADQKARHAICTDKEWVKAVQSVDKKNTKRMKEIIKEYGWLTISIVGKDGAEAAWLLAQHADLDIRFQKKCLKCIKEAAKKGEAELMLVAYLTDRVKVGEGKPQLYGTQFYENKKGYYGPRPIRDKKNLDKRRKKVGLDPFNEYKKRMEKSYRVFKKQRQVL